MIDTTVDGDLQAVRTAGTFLGTTLKGKVEDAGDDAQVDHLREATQKFDAYAGKLERTQTRMGTRRGEASGVGLVVNGDIIERPADAVAPTEPGAGATAEQGAQYTADNTAYGAQVEKSETYDRLLGEVAEDHESLEQWIHDNLDTFWSEVDGPSSATVLVDVLQKLPPAITGGLASIRAGDLRERAAGAGVDVRGNRSTARALDALAEGTETVARRLPITGTVASLGFAGGEIASGESPSLVIVGEVGGAVGGVVGGAAVAVGAVALTGAAAPVIAVAAGAAVVGIGVGLAAEHAYENWVPDDVRESIDEGPEDFGEGVVDAASDVGATSSPSGTEIMSVTESVFLTSDRERPRVPLRFAVEPTCWRVCVSSGSVQAPWWRLAPTCGGACWPST